MRTLRGDMARYSKAIAGAIGYALVWAQVVIDSPPGGITANEWLMLATGVAGVFGIYKVVNKDA